MKKIIEKNNNRALCQSTRKRVLESITVSVIVMALSSCSATRGPGYELAKQDEESFERPLRPPKVLDESESLAIRQASDEASSATELRVVKAPALPVGQAAQQAEQTFVPQIAAGDIHRQVYNNMPIPAFINEVYGNQLGLNFVLQPSIEAASDMVTLRVSQPISKQDFYVLATRTLTSYGVTTFEDNGALVFDYSAEVSTSTPLLASGRALPEVPSSSRPIFHIFPLSTVTTPTVNGLLRRLFKDTELVISEDPLRNSMLIQGKQQKIKEAIAAIELLDRPSMAGMNNIILTPAISTVTELSRNLMSILQTEGFSVGEGQGLRAIRLLPLESTGQLIVFANEQRVLDYIVEWAEKLEVQRQEEVQNGLFSYQVQSTQALHIVELLNTLGIAQAQPSRSSGSESTATNSPAPASSAQRGRYAVDEQLNTILFSGSGKDWVQSLAMIKQLDKPAPSVMIEIVLAEVTLKEEEKSAIEWLFNEGVDSLDLVGATTGFGASGSGLNFNLFRVGDDDGITRARLNFLYKNERSTIRARPRLMVKSGQEASIEVGDRVPIITSTQQSTITGNANLVQQVNYQETGVLLTIKPTVHATGFVDIEISQELSEADENTLSEISSPQISTRSIQTTLTLRDGGSVLMGGLIRSTDSDDETGVPGLAKLPLLGKLFRGDGMNQDRTELMIMIIPYILSNPEEAEALSDELQQERMRVIRQY